MTHILMSRSILDAKEVFPYIKTYLKPNMKVVILGFSFFGEFNKADYLKTYQKDSEYDLKMRKMFLSYGITDVTWIYYHSDDHDSAVEKIKQADILYFPGGAPDLMMNRIREYKLEEVIQAHQGIFIGSSAGAMIQKDIYHISPDNEYPNFQIEEGLGLLKGFIFEVHYRRRKKQKKAIKKMHRLLNQDVFIIPDDGVMIVSDGKVWLLNSARQLYDHKGKVKR